MSDVNINIRLVTAAAEANAKKLALALGGIDGAGKKASKSFFNLGAQLRSVSVIARGVFLGNIIQRGLFAIVGIAKDAATSFIEFEAALVGVGKTVGISGQELDDLGASIQRLSRDIPVASTELLAIAQVAGQLGVRGTANITKFTDTIARLGVTTDLSGESAALTLSRLQTITGESTQDIDKLASTIVRLGNNFKATESEIAGVGLDIARSTASFNFTSGEILAIATALKETGAQAEISGTQIGRVLREMEEAAAFGGKQLENFSDVLGVTVDDVKDLIKTDPTQALIRFTKGVRDLGEEAGGTGIVLARLGLNNERIKKVIPSLIANIDGLTRAYAAQADEQERNSALIEESQAVFSTTQSKTKTMGNAFDTLSEVLSKKLKPAFDAVASAMKNVFIEATLETQATLPGLEGKAARLELKLIDLNKVIENNGMVWDQSLRSWIPVGKTMEDLRKQQALLNIDLKETTGTLTAANAEYERSKIKLKELVFAENDLLLTRNQTEKSNTLILDQTNKEIVAIQKKIKAERDFIAAIDSGKKFNNSKDDAKVIAALDEQVLLSEIIQRGLDAKRAQEEEEVAIAKFGIDSKTGALQKFYLDKENLRQADALANATDAKKEEIRDKIKTKVASDVLKAESKSKRKKLKDERSFQGQINGLASSGSKEAFRIQQVMQVQQAILSSKSAVAGAMAWGNTLGGPALGAIMATLAKVATVAQISKIASTKPPSFQQGGIVPGSSFSGDKVDARVNSGEVILNREQQAKTLFAVANGAGGGQQNNQPQEMVTHVTVEVEGEAIARSVSRQVANGFKLGDNL